MQKMEEKAGAERVVDLARVRRRHRRCAATQQLKLNVVYIPDQAPAAPQVAAPLPIYTPTPGFQYLPPTTTATTGFEYPPPAPYPSFTPAAAAPAPQLMSPEQQAASTTQAYAEVHADRVAWET